MLRRIDHVEFAMPAGSEAAACAFCGGLLGLSEVPKPPNLGRRGDCWFESAEVRVHQGVEAEFRPARKAHPAFLADDLAALWDRLAAAGVEGRDDEPLEGHRRTNVADPFGNHLELVQAV